MRRFQAALARAGETAPEGASLKRMFAYWEAGERAVTVPAYQRAFVEIYEAPPEALGFALPDDSGPLAELREEPLHLVAVDSSLVEIVEAQTQYLRMLDRKLGSAALAAQAESHVAQLDSVLHLSAGPSRPALAAALAEAAALAGWQALDRADVAAAWRHHEQAKAAALESGDETVLTHVLAQQALILIDAQEPAMAAQAAEAAVGHASATPALMRAWVSAAYAEILAANGADRETRRLLEAARELLEGADGEDLPYLMLTPQHLARWRAHCLAKLGDLEVVDDLATALGGEGDSVRAATSLHTDLATAHLNAGDIPAARGEASAAMRMAERYGSRRQRKRLLAILARCQGEVVQQPDHGP
ncbi:hypothetical protein N864_05060 [Intrasporangium chromatireducens Q5-1]|uniref:Uncharacterized protein n=1 Tax=Intrasporangium chromatireducens Q5-1 TaxID=584657 RepID=W9GN87_9MICO|nr:hypothetical protein [Intrasporangium chromatireducens]EWT05364.1 hypothetical protein N864_05060 [Intrasporangium chromatireducens Q5-1]